MSAATDRLAKATAKVKAQKEAESKKEDTMANATTTSTAGAARPKVNIEVVVTSTFAIKSAFPFERLGKVFKEVILEHQVRTPQEGDAFEMFQAKFVWRVAALADVMGTPSLNIYRGKNGLYVSKNADYDIDGNTGKYSRLNGWAGKASISSEAVDYVKALIKRDKIAL